MKRKYCILPIIISAALLAGCLSACGESGTATGGSSSDENTAATVTGGDAATTPDTTANVEAPDVSGATTIALSGQSATATGTGAEVSDGVVTITAGGTYVVTGTMTEGRILVNAPKEEVTLVLQDAAITCSTGSPLYVYKSKATTLYLPEGTASTLTDGTDYTFSDSYSSAEEEEPNACLYSKSDLVIAGSGSLTVNANYNNGITGKDTLFIQKASVTVNAVNHGINGKDSLTIKDADITVTSGGDALRSTNDSDPTLGYLVITGSALKLTAGEDGIQAETTLTISGGKVKGLLPWKIEGNYICDDCHGVIDAQNGNDFTMEQFLKYRDFREQNQALREQFRVDEIVEFGFLSEKFVFDYEHSLFCMDKNLNKTIFHGSELKSFMISEDGAPLLEGSAKGFIHHESRVPQRIDELLPQVNQMLIQRQMQESMERLANRDKEVRPSYTSIDIPEPFKKFYIKLYLQHPYWSLYEFERTGPVIIGDVPDLNQYRIEYNESVQHLETLANALARVAGFPQESAAPGQTVAAAAVAAAAAAATAPTDAVAEIKKYKDLLDSGIITEEEFTAKKKQLMGI